MHQDQEQEWQPQATYNSQPREDGYLYPLERVEESRDATEKHTNGWDVLTLIISRFFDWLKGIEWGEASFVIILLISTIATIILELIQHWH